MSFFTIKRVIWILILIALAFILFGCGDNNIDEGDAGCIQQESHNWGTLAWPAENYHLTIKNNADSRVWDESLTLAIEDWNNLGTALTLEEVGGGEYYDIQVIDKDSNAWLGLAEIWTSEETGYIARGRVSMSTLLLSGYSSEAIRHVMCQELGHILALGHIVGNTCMDDCSAYAPRSGDKLQCLDTPDKVSPNEHDREQLVLLYGEAVDECN